VCIHTLEKQGIFCRWLIFCCLRKPLSSVVNWLGKNFSWKEKCIRSFGRKAWRKETSWKT
jgi:hypothetical protein